MVRIFIFEPIIIMPNSFSLGFFFFFLFDLNLGTWLNIT